jgi:RNA polymerase sigma factor (sigma-70 family)
VTQENGSISHWLQQLKAGRESGAWKLWHRYRPALMKLARRKLSDQSTAIADEEDIVICAFESFLRRVREGAYGQVNGRGELWKLLVTITLNKAYKHNRDSQRTKRAGPVLYRVDPVNEYEQAVQEALSNLASRELAPDLVASISDSLTHLLSVLGDPELQQIATAKLKGYTNQEIAQLQDRSLPTIERRMRLIRDLWQQELLG